MQSDMPEELCHFFLPLKAREEQEEERKFHVTFHFLAKFSCKSDDINKGEEMKTAKLLNCAKIRERRKFRPSSRVEKSKTFPFRRSNRTRSSHRGPQLDISSCSSVMHAFESGTTSDHFPISTFNLSQTVSRKKNRAYTFLERKLLCQASSHLETQSTK